MSSSSSNLPDSADVNQPRSSEAGAAKDLVPKNLEDQAVKTFEFEVSAGRTARAEDAKLSALAAPTASPPAKRVPATPTQAEVAPTTLPQAEAAPKAASVDSSAPKSAAKSLSVESFAQAKTKAKTKQPTAAVVDLPTQVDIRHNIRLNTRLAAGSSPADVGAARRIARQSSWWITSLSAHILLLICLAFSTLAVMQEEELELYASPAVYETVEEFEDLEIDPAEQLDLLEEELNTPDPDTLANLGSETLIEEPTLSEIPIAESASAEVASSLAELGQLFGDQGTGLSGMDDELGSGKGGAMAKFFGTEIKARHILYMLDNSGGMRKGGKFEALVSELLTSVRALNPKQKFYVIFYSDTVYPLFFPYSVREFIRSTPKSQKKLAAWLDSVELCGGNAIDEALAAAEVIRPDAVFLLTDGDLFTSEKKQALLLNRAGRSYAIHTFGLGVGKQTRTADGLRQVAEVNGGTFRAIKVTDEMKALEKEKQRPYHNKKPGAVWGLKVGRRW